MVATISEKNHSQNYPQKKDDEEHNKLIPVDKVIQMAQETGVNFGPGKPYNRLRYYTKIGWIPHMTRKGKDLKGHYPEWVISRLKLIEELREKDYNNEQITLKLMSENPPKNQNSNSKRLGKDNHENFGKSEKEEILKEYLIKIIIAIVVMLILNELGIMKVGKNREKLIKDVLKNFPAMEIPVTGIKTQHFP